MARLFDDASAQYLKVTSVAITVAPLTLACWFKSDSIAIRQLLMDVGDKDNTQNYWRLELRGDTGGDPLRAATQNGGSFGAAVSSSGFSSGVEHHACAVFTASNSRAIFIDGGSKGTNGDNVTPSGADAMTIGNKVGSVASTMSGNIGEAAIWNVALSDAEVAILAKGFSPLFLRLQNLVAYWPLIRENDLDIIGGFHMTAFNAPTVAAHPPKIIYPTNMFA